MALLSCPLSNLMSQITENQIAELKSAAYQHRAKLHKQRLVEQGKREKMKEDLRKIQLKNDKLPSSSFRRQNEQKSSPKQELIATKQVGSKQAKIHANGMNLSKKSKYETDLFEEKWIEEMRKNELEKWVRKGGDTGEEHKSSSGEEVVPFKRFQKVARKAVIANSMKQGRDICTCSSLDAICKAHDV